jgi:hypothetical protein
MNRLEPDVTARLRRWVYILLIASSAGVMIGRILAVQSPDQKTPFLSANDRSRWCTIRALVEHGTYAIDEVIQDDHWDTIDKVRHTGRDGQQHFYSSKPPLLTTMLAGQYWLIHAITSATLATHPFYVGRAMLIITNVVPMAVFFVLLALMLERWGKTDWGRIFVMMAATWGTFLTTFAVTLNNHLIAAVAVMLALFGAMRIWCDGKRQWWYFGLTGLFAGLAAINELPAVALMAALGAALLWKFPLKTLAAFLPAVVVVALAFFGTNYAAHNTWSPPYSQRHVEGGWYDYPGSHWSSLRLEAADRPDRDDLEGVDAGEPSVVKYALHSLIGHHGIFSLTPIWLLVPIGIVLLARRRRQPLQAFAVMVAVLTVILLVFYLGLRPAADRNYGGVASGFRWMFWFTPMWLLVMLPAADWLAGSHRGRAAAIVLLLVSVISASYPLLNPWQHPWIYQLWLSLR